MKIVSVDGKILDVFGPFPATKNDATILERVFKETQLERIFRRDDVVLVDRGFRDCVQFLRHKGFDVKIPNFIEKGNIGQLTTKQGNMSRLVTKMRYAMEVANGMMKNKWKLFAKISPSILTLHLMADYKIGAALLNAFNKPIICDKVDSTEIGRRMLSADSKNELRPITISKGFSRTARMFLQSVDPTQLKFPRFNEEQLKNFSLGSYSIRQAISYTAEHLKIHGQFQIASLPEKYVWAHFGKLCAKHNFKTPMLVSASIKSRFKGQKYHTVYVLYDYTAVIKSQIFPYCSCQHGQRTIGCCSHVMAVVWFLGYGRYEAAKDPAAHFNYFFNDVI